MSPWLSDALLRTQSDERLVALTRGGHERAFAAIVERYRRPLLAFARRGAPEERAEDVVQQALMSAWAALAAGAEVAHLRGWLHQIVRHETIRAARKEGRDVHDPLDPAVIAGGRGAESEVEQRLQVREALAGIAELPESQREAFVQTAVAGRSRSEVAATLGLSEGAVRQLVHRARSTLRTAATALTPLPLASWAAAAGGGGPGVAELAAGAGTATIGGVLLKTSVALVATGAIATGVTVSDRHGDSGRRAPAPAAVTQTTGGGVTSGGTPTSGHGEAEPGDDHGGRGSGGDDHSGRGSSGHGGDDGRSGHGGGSGSDGGSGSSGGSGSADSSGRGSGSGGGGSGHEGSGPSGRSGSNSGIGPGSSGGSGSSGRSGSSGGADSRGRGSDD